MSPSPSLLPVITVLGLVVGSHAFHLPFSLLACCRRKSISSHVEHIISELSSDGEEYKLAHQTLPLRAVSSRRELIISGLTTAVASPFVAFQPPANALVDESLIYNGVYTDPKHPKGYRLVVGTTKSATLTLQDDPNDTVYKIPVQVQPSTTNQVEQFVFDFASKGGPSNIVGEFAKDKEGIPIIHFPADGNNTWKKRETGPIGVYQDSNNPKKNFVIRQLKGPELIVDEVESNGDVNGIAKAKAGNPFVFDFPEGKESGAFSMKEKKITFENGRVWTKY